MTVALATNLLWKISCAQVDAFIWW